ncbi:protein-methionine-sulfoxide reductase heme-binding subunit MsrQ [Shewanella dokdonensis]|uniref:Protein-methionine-sulfoxide reductase heme-binding subunit MsrQ n=1 Tax=Shewanella dokdonensis TaxID=712036 RepID=A0ABX8DER5_9GAMM|nr:protein-methionine-sulfoxide reductase heme-binding subunit MsrQ [Shewanella dokdonensis]MCL1076099.1 protein-methionine-sulfoxide reductase heme-binding subunit MsrQ [Shewanella dokdonensis]QVK23175.1 protein-methionine-sulfoxide reductase heme-binding subunit MsrQ [Shewanella dokdonensis]
MWRISRRQLFWGKALLHLAAALPLLWLLLAVNSDAAGGDPVQYIIHFLGKGALNLLLLTLLVSPLARWSKQGMLMQLRRPLGLWTFSYACLHLAAYFSLDLLFAWQLLVQEIVKRPYIVVGASAWLILLSLALTSFKAAQRRMGRHWQQLHYAVYPAVMLVTVHYYWSVKSEIIEPSIYIVLALLLLSLRIKPLIARWRR